MGGDGSRLITNESQRRYGGHWRRLGRINTNGTQENYVQVEHFANTGPLMADAVAYVPANTFPSASWEDRTVSTPFSLSATWSADASRTARASYVVRTLASDGAGGCRVITKVVDVDQRQPGAVPVPLGNFESSTTCSGVKVTLQPNDAAGTLSADAIIITTP